MRATRGGDRGCTDQRGPRGRLRRTGIGVTTLEGESTSHAAARCDATNIRNAVLAAQRFRRHLPVSWRDLHGSRRQWRFLGEERTQERVTRVTRIGRGVASGNAQWLMAFHVASVWGASLIGRIAFTTEARRHRATRRQQQIFCLLRVPLCLRASVVNEMTAAAPMAARSRVRNRNPACAGSARWRRSTWRSQSRTRRRGRRRAGRTSSVARPRRTACAHG